eukprot:350971-Chlamydomonas_euryale.AAC.1
MGAARRAAPPTRRAKMRCRCHLPRPAQPAGRKWRALGENKTAQDLMLDKMVGVRRMVGLGFRV